jgi:heterodisulfide reductase subunit A
LTLSDILNVSGEKGNFEVEILESPRYVDLDRCIGCGTCAEKCPKKVVDDYNIGLNKRKAIYVPYAQAVPLKYAIDSKNCIYLTKGKCGNCKKVCPVDAINYEDEEKRKTLRVGAIILTPGFQAFDPSELSSYQYAKHPNVITSMEFERILSASGPTMGHVTRPSDNSEPKRIAWLQCVGSRDVNQCDHAYCSAVCCMYAIKEAVIAKEHGGADLDCAIFYMDIRTHGKDFERYCDDAREKHGVRFVHTRVPKITAIPGSDDLLIQYAHQDGTSAHETFDMIVLSVGLENPPELIETVKRLGINLTEGEFCATSSFRPVATSRDGVYACGVFAGPKDIPQSVIEASSAAAETGILLSTARNTMTQEKEVRKERDIVGERPRIGVFVCQCGINISGVVDVPAVRDYASTLPYVEYATDNLYACSQDSQEAIAKLIEDKGLNRVVVAACTPKTHEPLFQETLVDAGLNKYVFEMTNIRNQNSWVHKEEPEMATLKAKDLIRMAISKVALMEPLKEAELEVDQRALIVGGGISGMVSANTLASQGYHVSLVEKSDMLGGNARSLFRTWKGEPVQRHLSAMIRSVESDPNIDIYLKTEIANVEGFVGNFRTTLSSNGKAPVLEHGIAVLATGGMESKPNEYLYGQDRRIVTHLELDKRFIDHDKGLKDINDAVFIQCVGSRVPERPYCSRVCCTHSVESALHLKKINPEMNVYILFRDLRTYGEREYLYREAREAGVIFIRYDLEHKPKVAAQKDYLEVKILDKALGRKMILQTDLLVLATGIVSPKDEKLAQFFKVPMNEDGFFVEAHAKLGPSEFATDGVFLCGTAHYPKPIDESVAQAQAAVSRAVTLLARKKIHVSGNVAMTDPASCSSCGVCIELCPYSAPSFIQKGPFSGKAEINSVLCKGCGLCVASCRSGAINLKGFGTDQIMAMINEI